MIEDHRAPVVTSMVWYRVGAADDPPGQSGVAHFLEHLMFKGTAALPEGQFSRIVAENGGEDNAFTSYDYTAYFQHIAADRLDLVLGMEADRMVNLTVPRRPSPPSARWCARSGGRWWSRRPRGLRGGAAWRWSTATTPTSGR